MQDDEMTAPADSRTDADVRRRVETLEADNAKLRRERDQAVEEAQRVAKLLDSQVTPVTYLGIDGSILMVNAAAAENLGGTPIEVIGRSIFDAFPEHAERTRARIRRAVQSRQPVLVDGQAELSGGGARWFRSIYSPVFDGEEVTAVQLMSQDVTALKRAEAELVEQQLQLATVMESAPDIICVIERDATVRYVNRVGPGYRREDVVGQPGASFVPEADRQRYRSCLAAVFECGETQQFDFTDALGNDWETRIVPVAGESPIRRAISFATEVSERKKEEERHRQLEAQMQHAQKLESLGVLAGGIAHDFNNLLVGMLGNAELALLGTPDLAAHHRIEDIIASARSAADLCRQMLAYSGKGKFIVRQVELSSIVHEMADFLRASISKRAELRYEFEVGLPLVEVDVAQLRQVVMNLIVNASDALGDEDGIITLTTRGRHCTADANPKRTVNHRHSGSHVVLEISDTGCGMDEATTKRMFEPFFTSKEPGRGLGLAAVHGIVRGHHGCLEVETAPGKGTKVLVCLPSVPCAVDQPNDDCGPPTRPATGGVVLVVDDDEAVRKVCRLALQHAGYDVLTARDGAEAIATFEQRRSEIAAVLLDMSMPHMGGRETLDALRALDPDVRVVITSGYHQGDAIEQLGESKSLRFLPKPSPIAQMLDAIERVRA